jgi:hypothetical protein
VLCPDCKPGTTSAVEGEGDGKRDLFASSDSDTDSDEEDEKKVAKAVTAVTRSAKGQQTGGKQSLTQSVGETPKGKQLSAAQKKKIKAAGRKKAAAKDAANEGKPRTKRKYRKREK